MYSRFQLHAGRLELASWANIPAHEIPDRCLTEMNDGEKLRHLILRFNAQTNQRELVWMQAGLVPSYAQDDTGADLRIEAHAEVILCASWLGTAFRRRRCLVPAKLLKEHERLSSGTYREYSFAPASNEVFSLAAVWDSWTNHAGHTIETFAVISILTAQLLRPLFKRMPVIIEPQDRDRWLHSSIHDPLPLDVLKPLSVIELRKWKIMPCTNGDPVVSLLAD